MPVPADGDEISDETSTTRLYSYELAEVKAMCVDGKTKSDVKRSRFLLEPDEGYGLDGESG